MWRCFSWLLFLHTENLFMLSLDAFLLSLFNFFRFSKFFLQMHQLIIQRIYFLICFIILFVNVHVILLLFDFSIHLYGVILLLNYFIFLTNLVLQISDFLTLKHFYFCPKYIKLFFHCHTFFDLILE